MKNYPILKRSSLALLFPALAPALGGAVSVRAAFFLGLLVLILTVVSGALNATLFRRVPLGARLVCTVIIAVTGTTLARFLLIARDSELLQALGVFLPLVTVNILILRQVVLYEPENGGPERFGLVSSRRFGWSVWMSLVFVLVLAGVGAVRETLLTGSLGSTAILAIDLSFFGSPGGLLIVIGTLLAAGRAVGVRHD